jgi:hypothetical protein
MKKKIWLLLGYGLFEKEVVVLKKGATGPYRLAAARVAFWQTMVAKGPIRRTVKCRMGKDRLYTYRVIEKEV